MKEITLIPCSYQIAGVIESIQIQRLKNLAGDHIWKITDNTGMVLNKHGEWEPEPQPSERNPRFRERTRYMKLEEAVEQLKKEIERNPLIKIV